MKKTIFTLPFLLLTLLSFAQKKVSVVELFTNTGDLDARLAIPELAQQAAISDTSDLNHVEIQYHVDKAYPDWTDAYARPTFTQRFNQYQTWGIIDSIAGVAKNGAASTATLWYDASPEEKDIYSSGAKKVTVLFRSYEPASRQLVVEYVLGRTYSQNDNTTIQVLVLENNVPVNVTGGENAGETFTMHHVARAFRSHPATEDGDTMQFTLPADLDLAEARVVAIVQDENTGNIVGGTRGFALNPFVNAPGSTFAVVEEFVNSGCFGGPSAISSMYQYAADADTNDQNEVLVQLHIGQTYGDWTDVYKLPLNEARYDKYSWDMGILAGLAAVAKNGIRYKPHAWNNCSPLHQKDISFVELDFNHMTDTNLVVDYTLSGEIGKHDRVYFYVVESDIRIYVTGGEVPGTTLDNNNLVRVARVKTAQAGADTVLLRVPSDVNLHNARVMAYIQNDVTYNISGGSKGFTLEDTTSTPPDTTTNDIPTPNAQPNITVYPNPTTGPIHLQLSQLENNPSFQIELRNALGQLHYQQRFQQAPNIVSINHLQLPAGMYYISFKTNSALITKPIYILCE